MLQSTHMTVCQVAQETADRLLREYSAEEVWLFGSQARGEATADSDIDLLAIVPTSTESRYRRAVAARKLISDVRIPMNIVVLTRQEWEKELKVPSSLPSTVKREGIPLHHAT